MKQVVLLTLLHLAQDPAPATVTFAKDVAPIVFARCATCHRPGDVAPFPLLAYGDVKKRAKQILTSVENRQMPPWKPVEGYGDFVGARRMADAEIETVRKWVDQGCAEGEAKDLPAPPKFSDGWDFGEPDLVVTMPEPYTIPAEGKDLYRAFVVPLHLAEDKYIRAVQFRPSNKRAVHHVLLFTDASPESRKKDDADPEPGFDGWQLGLSAIITGTIGKWNPGGLAHPLPEGMGRDLKKGSDLVLQIHFNPIGRPVEERSQIGFYFTKEVPQRLVVPLPLLNPHVDLPAGEKEIKITDRFVLPVGIDVIGAIPHAHYLGKECKVWAKDPDGKETPLIWIKDWDFGWQEQYRYKAPIRLVKGTELNMVWTFDNSADNPRNPTNPPRRVGYGQGSRDEMAMAYLQVSMVGTNDRMKLFFSILNKPRRK